MSNSASIAVTIAPAAKDHLFTENLELKENAMFFLYDNSKRTVFSGPYWLNENYSLEDIVTKWKAGEIYTVVTPVEGEVAEGYTFILHLREALPSDFKRGKELRLGLQFYVKYQDFLEGPFITKDPMNVKQLGEDLHKHNVYLPADEQDFVKHRSSYHNDRWSA